MSPSELLALGRDWGVFTLLSTILVAALAVASGVYQARNASKLSHLSWVRDRRATALDDLILAIGRADGFIFFPKLADPYRPDMHTMAKPLHDLSQEELKAGRLTAYQELEDCANRVQLYCSPQLYAAISSLLVACDRLYSVPPNWGPPGHFDAIQDWEKQRKGVIGLTRKELKIPD